MCRNDQKTLYLDFKDVLNFEASGKAGDLTPRPFSFSFLSALMLIAPSFDLQRFRG
jgi:hypothetical protein